MCYDRSWTELHSVSSFLFKLLNMLTLSLNGEALRKLDNVPEGEGAEAWRRSVEYHEPKQASLFLEVLRQIPTYDFGDFGQVIHRVEIVRSTRINLARASQTCPPSDVSGWQPRREHAGLSRSPHGTNGHFREGCR